MAVRRIVRPSLLRAEAPSAPACSSCRHLSSALHLPARSDSQHQQQQPANAQSNLARHASTGWAAISQAGHALFTPSPPADSSPPLPRQLSATAQDLVQQVKFRRPDTHKVWQLFTELDLTGEITSLPLASLHALLPALHRKPSSSRPLTLAASNKAARQYASRADLVRTRLREAGGTPTPGDFNALLAQYFALRNGPAANQVWEEMLELGFAPTKTQASTLLETYAGWIALHGRASGRAVERTVAEPLVRKALAVLDELQRGGKDVDRLAIEMLLKIAVKAQDFNVFASTVKQFYAFDIQLPGAYVDVAHSQPVLDIGEAEVNLMLELFAEKDDVPGMMAIFETFDQPTSKTRAADPAFFTQSFSALSLSDADPSPSSAQPHPVGIRAFTTLIQAAARLDNGLVARHYFYLLFSRWREGAEERIAAFERSVGIDPEDRKLSKARRAKPVEVEESDEAQEQVVEAKEPQEEDESLREWSAFPTWNMASALWRAPAQPASPYHVPSPIVAELHRQAVSHYDAATVRWLRRRLWRMARLGENYRGRLQAALDRVEDPFAASSASAATRETATAPSTASVAPILPSATATAIAMAVAANRKAVAALRRELSLTSYHLTQLRLTTPTLLLDANIIEAWKTLHANQTSLSYRSQRVVALAKQGNKRELVRARPALRRKEKLVLLHRMVVVRHRLTRLRKVDGQGPGSPEYEKYRAELRVLQKKADGEGWTEVGDEGEVLGVKPHVAGLEATEKQ
ncbi:hypothetical protein JCM10207_009131 [Rhodosporidiobolus poonsookiae]